jgi:hypothetical protein
MCFCRIGRLITVLTEPHPFSSVSRNYCIFYFYKIHFNIINIILRLQTFRLCLYSCMHFVSLRCLLPVWTFFIRDLIILNKILLKPKNYEVPHCVFFSRVMLLSPLYIQIFFLCISSLNTRIHNMVCI